MEVTEYTAIGMQRSAEELSCKCPLRPLLRMVSFPRVATDCMVCVDEPDEPDDEPDIQRDWRYPYNKGFSRTALDIQHGR